MAHWQATDIRSVLVRHKKTCPHYVGASCACEPSFRGEVWNSEAGRTDKSPAFANADEAMTWVSHQRRFGARRYRPEDGPSPTVIQAALDVLTRAGFRVEPPPHG
jgi:hypothetical protein